MNKIQAIAMALEVTAQGLALVAEDPTFLEVYNEHKADNDMFANQFIVYANKLKQMTFEAEKRIEARRKV